MRGFREKSAVILDRHPLWLDAMDRLVVGVGVEVVGRSTDGDEAVALIEEHRPDVFIAGIDPASSEQVVYVRKASESHPGIKSVVVADNTEPEAINAAFAAGAAVYCVKTAEQEDLASAIRQAFERSIFIATNGSRDFSLGAPSAELQPAAHDLTRRELEILQLVAEGHSNSQLARMLWVTEQTVKFHLSNIYRKLDVANRTEASRWAQLHGLLPTHRGHEEPDGALATSAT
jgi:DNA-binding NarL/FixJ family response regulator